MNNKSFKQKSLSTSLLITIFILLSLGFIFVFEASSVEALRLFDDKYFFAKQQLKWLGIGSVVFLLMSILPINLIKKSAVLFFGLSLFLMVIVLIPGIGTHTGGARRWISLGFMSLQPTEPLKLALVLYFSSWLSTKTEMKFKPFVFLLMLVVGLTMLQPDLGTSIVLISVSLTMLYLSGADLSRIYYLLGGVILVTILLILISPYRRDRLQTYLNPLEDRLGKSYHINQAITALGSGGLTGVGIGQSRQKYAYLPMSSTDSIFAVIGEEIGFLGSVAIVGIYLYLINLGFKIASTVSDNFEKLAAAGISAWLLIQFGLNMSAIVAIFPLTGVPLPLVSYGGSALVSTLAGLGLLFNISKRT